MLFGYVVIALSVFLFVASVITVAWSWRLYRRGRKSVAAPFGVIALTLMVGIPSVWAYALIDHRPHRTIQLDFRRPQPDILREADAYCRPSVSGVSCGSQKYITDVSVRLHDGAVLSLVSSLLSWQVDGGDVLTHISFRSNDNF